MAEVAGLVAESLRQAADDPVLAGLLAVEAYARDAKAAAPALSAALAASPGLNHSVSCPDPGGERAYGSLGPDGVVLAPATALFDHLLAFEPTPVVGLNRAAAVSKAHGPAAGLDALDALAVDQHAASELESYRYYHAARADMLLRLDRVDDAADSYRRALELTTNDSERRFLSRRLADCTT